jgi:transcriptional regulator with XRE-family HTH domain
MDFAAALRDARVTRGLSLRALAAVTGMNFTYLSKLESGRLPPPTDEKVAALAATLQTDAEPLLRLARESRVPPTTLRQVARRHPAVAALVQRLQAQALTEEDLVLLERGLVRTAQPAELPAGRPLQAHAHESALILHLVATGLLRAADGIRDSPESPYPRELQRALDRLTVLGCQLGVAAPQSVPDLIGLCRQPLGTWPLRLEAAAVGEGDLLLDGIRVTELCQEWTISSPDVQAEVNERRTLLPVLDACRSAGNQPGYVAFRRLIIEHPVRSHLELQLALTSPDLLGLEDWVVELYKPVPPEAVVDGTVRTCGVCGNLLLPRLDGSLGCSEDRCARSGKDAIGAIYNARERVLAIGRELRKFVAAPGRAELALEQQLIRRGLVIELWPGFDAYDLLATFPTGERWAIDLKDWVSPLLLARAVRPIPRQPAWDRAWFVFPQDRGHRTGYVQIFKDHTTVLGGEPPVEAALERTFLARMDRALAGIAHA